MSVSQARRLGDRTDIHLIAKIIDDQGCVTQAMIKDLSLTGARLEVPANTAVPRRFTLRMVRDAREMYVETVWRKDNQVGVAVCTAPEIAPVTPPTPVKRISVADLRAMVNLRK